MASSILSGSVCASMPKRVRDYKAEYAARTRKAKKQGYTGYSQKRKVRRYTRELTQRFMDRIDTEGFNLADLLDEGQDNPEYWIWFRVNYGQGPATA